MKEFKGTKGEWNVVEFEDGSDCFVQAPRKNISDPHAIEIMQDGWDEMYSYEQKLADAKLISSAPELLKSLQNMVKVFDIMHNQLTSEDLAIKQAIEAISKAIG